MEHTEMAQKMGVSFLPIGSAEFPVLPIDWRNPDVVVDAITGTGIRGDLRDRLIRLLGVDGHRHQLLRHREASLVPVDGQLRCPFAPPGHQVLVVQRPERPRDGRQVFPQHPRLGPRELALRLHFRRHPAEIAGDPVELGEVAPGGERVVQLGMVRGEDVFDGCFSHL